MTRSDMWTGMIMGDEDIVLDKDQGDRDDDGHDVPGQEGVSVDGVDDRDKG